MSPLSLRHALHVSIAALLGLGVARAWQQAASLPDGHRRAVWASVLAGLLLALYLAGAFAERRAGARLRLVWLTSLVGLWVLGSVVTEGFLWVAFPLYFLVLTVLPAGWGAAAVASMVGWSVVSALLRERLDGVGDLGVGTWLGPLLGAVSAIGAYAVFGRLARDAERHRALVAQLRAAQAELAVTERTNGMLAERERLAREIHDTIAQGLGSIVLMARTAQERPGSGDQLAVIEATARDNLVEARRFVRDLGSGSPSLEESLRRLAADTGQRAVSSGRPLDVSFRAEGAPWPLGQRAREALHRGVQASVANVVQHADASRCVITLTWWADRVTVDVADDGRGFDPAAPAEPDSFGIGALRARLAEAGGTVTLEAAPREGTTVSMSMPREGTA